MEYITATKQYEEQIYKLVQDTIIGVYPKYYPKEVVDFFCHLHNKEKISQDIGKGYVGILINDNQLLGTGSYENNHITRVYVTPKFHGKGYGSFIMQSLEHEIALKYRTIYLDASLSAVNLYEKLGYKTVKHEKYVLENDSVLVYEVMKKEI